MESGQSGKRPWSAPRVFIHVATKIHAVHIVFLCRLVRLTCRTNELLAHILITFRANRDYYRETLDPLLVSRRLP
jgi:hypothetical protein